MTRSLAWFALLGLALAVGCGDDSGTGGTGGIGGDAGSGGGGSGGVAPPDDFAATIVRTSLGIPHITADDFGGLGYGAGYAYAEDNYCVLMREVIRSNGETARWFGEDEGNLNEDYVYTFFNSDEYIRTEFIPAASAELQQTIRGYAAGMNRYLAETGVDNLPEGPEGCRDADWVRDITNIDLAKVYRKLIVRAGIQATNSLIMAADDVAPTQSTASLAPALLESPPFNQSVLGIPEPSAFGSNAYGIGAEGSQTDYGILLGNPHFPWEGSLRWYVHHLVVPGQYDVMGASLQGVPVVNVGFNNDLAWSHTVSTAQRFSFFELELLDDDPYKYMIDDDVFDIEVNPVTIEVMLEDGTIESRTQNIYMTEYGPVVNLGGLSELVAGWPTNAGTLFAIRDANIDNTRILDQFTKMGQATSIDELEDALGDIGLPWVNTIAADREGTGFYADVSTVPNVSQEKLADCADSIYTIAITNLGVAALNGSRSECQWGTDSDGPPGLLGYDNLPKLRTGGDVEYVSNSNDSYWLSNPDSLLENYSPLMGRNGLNPPERIQQSLRTRQGFVQAEERIAGTDGLGDAGFTVDLMREVMFQSRNIAGELTRDDVVAICKGVGDWSAAGCGDGAADPYSANPTEAAEACTILEDWDGLFNIDSVGPALWRNVWFRMNNTDDLWAVPFDADDAVSTPNTLNDDDPAVIEAVRCALGGGVDFLVAESIPLDRPWGEVQFRWNGDRSEQIPVHGGSGGFMWSVISSNFVEGEGYSDIPTGNSYIQTVTWDETECPDAYAVLTYSQSTNPDSPHYSDWTELFSAKTWNDMPYCPDDVEADKVSEIVISTDD
ncbi:MAG: penicillin acylase family protein [Polyangiales bacterium]